MQAVILAAGHGSRMVELTTAIPKPMLDLLGKPLLEYKFEILGDEFDEIIIVVGYAKEVIESRFGASYLGKKITYVEQVVNGTAGALWSAKDILKGKFMVMMGDDVYAKEDVAACLALSDGWAVVTQGLEEMYRAGSVEVGDDGLVANIIEGDLGSAPGLASTNMFLFDARIFTAPLIPKQEGSLEFGLPQTAVAAAHSLGIPFHPIYTTRWIQINAPKDLVTAATILKSERRS